MLVMMCSLFSDKTHKLELRMQEVNFFNIYLVLYAVKSTFNLYQL